jgi:hypothetical protein
MQNRILNAFIVFEKVVKRKDKSLIENKKKVELHWIFIEQNKTKSRIR